MGPLNSFYKKSYEYRLVSLALVFIFLITILQVPVANALWRDVLGVSGEVGIVPPPPPSGQSGTSISADVTANIDSEQDDEEGDHQGEDQAEENKQQHEEKEDYLEVKGQLCVNNIGDATTQDLRALLQLQYKPEKGKFQDLPEVFIELIPSEPLEPGASQCYNYQMGFSPLAGVEDYRITASVTITNHSGYLPGGHHCPGPVLCPFGPTPKASFTIPKREDDCIEKVESILDVTPLPTETVDPTLPTEVTPLPTESVEPVAPTEETPLPTEFVDPVVPTEEAPLPTEVVETSPPPQETELPAVTEEPAPPTEVTEEPPPSPPPVE